MAPKGDRMDADRLHLLIRSLRANWQARGMLAAPSALRLVRNLLHPHFRKHATRRDNRGYRTGLEGMSLVAAFSISLAQVSYIPRRKFRSDAVIRGANDSPLRGAVKMLSNGV